MDTWTMSGRTISLSDASKADEEEKPKLEQQITFLFLLFLETQCFKYTSLVYTLGAHLTQLRVSHSNLSLGISRRTMAFCYV